MSALQYIYYFCLNSILLGVLSWFFIALTSLIALPLRIPEKIYQLIVKSIQIYFLSAITALLTLRAIQDNNSTIAAMIGYALLGLWLLYATLGSNLYQRTINAQYVLSLKEAIEYDVFFIIGAPVLFLIILFFPRIGYNPLTLGAVNIIAQIYNIPIAGWFLGLIAFLYLLSMLWGGFMLCMFGIGYCYRKLKKPNCAF